MVIRPAAPEDIPAIVELERQGFDEPLSPGLVRVFLDLAGPGCLVACRPEVVGYGLAAAAMERDTVWILALVVREELRNRGIGVRIGEALFSSLLQRGFKHVLLTVRPDNDVIIKMCSRLGFAQIASDPNYFGRGQARLVLKYSVADS